MAGDGAAEVMGRAAAQGVLRQAVLPGGAAPTARRLRDATAQHARRVPGHQARDTARRVDARVRPGARSRPARVAREGAAGARAMIAAVLAAAGPATRQQSARVADVQLAAQHLRGDHPNLFHDLEPARFGAVVSTLEAQADRLDDDELLVGLMRLGALPGARDGHTGVFPLNPGNRRLLHAYPTRFYTFSDGVYVVGQANGSDLLRARLVAVNGHPVEDVLAAVRPLVPHDNESTLTLRATTFLNTPEVLHGLHLAPDVGPLRFTFERDGQRLDADLAPIGVDTYER